MQSVKVQAAATLALSLAFALPALAADGDFDPTFGIGGIAYLTPDLEAAQELQPFASVVLPDGKILFGGSLDAPTSVPFEQEYRVMFARFNADGTVDTTFGNSTIPGVVKLDKNYGVARLYALRAVPARPAGKPEPIGVQAASP